MSFEVLPPEDDDAGSAGADPRRVRWHELFHKVRDEGQGNWCQIESYDIYNKAVWTAHRLRRYASTLVPPGVWDIRAKNLNDTDGDFQRSSLQVRFIKGSPTTVILASPKGRKPVAQGRTVGRDQVGETQEQRAEPAPPSVSEQPQEVAGGADGSVPWSQTMQEMQESNLPLVGQDGTVWHPTGTWVEQDVPEVFTEQDMLPAE